MATRYTDAQRTEALDLYLEHGPAEASRRTGIPAATIRSWASRNDLTETRNATVGAAVAARKLSFEERRTALAHGLLDDIARLRAELFSDCTERKALVVSDGKDAGSHVEIVDIDRTRPTFAEQARIMTAIGIAVDKTQLLSGAATERHEHVQVDAVDAEIARLEAELAANDPSPEAAPVGPA